MQVSLVNGDTGELVEKTEPGRRVTSFYEGTNVSSILPLMTQPFDFRLGEISVFLCQPSYRVLFTLGLPLKVQSTEKLI